MSSILRNIQTEWQEFLEAVPFFEPVPILFEDMGDIQSEFDRAMGASTAVDNKTGLCVIIRTVAATIEPGDSGFGPVLRATCAADIIEDVIANRGATGIGITALELAEAVASYTHGQFQPASANEPLTLIAPGISAAENITEDGSAPVFGRTITMTTSCGLTKVLDQVATPSITTADGQTSITCATPGAVIFYTTSGRKPTPTSTLYTAPIAAASIRARAFRPGYLASAITEN